MKIKRKVEFEQFYNGVKFTIKYEMEDREECFIDCDALVNFLETNYKKYNENYGYLDVFALEDEEFLKEANIEFIKDEDGGIIPIGIVDFQNKFKRLSRLCFTVDRSAKLYRVPYILRNIEKAIRIKYKAVDFMNMSKEEESFIEL